MPQPLYYQLLNAMKHIKLSLLFLALIAVMDVSAQTADRLMRGVAEKVSSSPSVELQFTINGSDGPVQGSAVLSGAYFTLSTPIVKVWYDGLTQWTMLCSTQEVSITEPTAEELMESNPFAILRSYASRYSVRKLSDVGVSRRVELTPLHGVDTDIQRVIVLIGADGWPTGAEVRYGDNRVIGASIDHISSGTAKPQSSFRYNAALNPASEIIDLR